MTTATINTTTRQKFTNWGGRQVFMYLKGREGRTLTAAYKRYKLDVSKMLGGVRSSNRGWAPFGEDGTDIEICFVTYVFQIWRAGTDKRGRREWPTGETEDYKVPFKHRASCGAGVYDYDKIDEQGEEYAQMLTQVYYPRLDKYVNYKNIHTAKDINPLIEFWNTTRHLDFRQSVPAMPKRTMDITSEYVNSLPSLPMFGVNKLELSIPGCSPNLVAAPSQNNCVLQWLCEHFGVAKQKLLRMIWEDKENDFPDYLDNDSGEVQPLLQEYKTTLETYKLTDPERLSLSRSRHTNG